MVEDVHPLPVEEGWTEVDSTCLARVRVVPRGPTVCEFQVEFLESGARWGYSAVPYFMAADFFLAPSKGSYYNDQIKGKFKSRPIHG
jgi:hypothetical protein